MSARLTISALCVALALSLAGARDQIQDLPIDKALASADAKSKLGKKVQFYFGSQKHGKVLEDLGEFKTNKKTNAFNKTDTDACNWAFLSALLALRDRALKEGGNAVINIRSNYKNMESSSETTYQCGSGNVVCGVALIGTIVNLEEGASK